MAGDRTAQSERAPIKAARQRLAAASPAESSARALFESVGRARVCALLRSEHAIDYRFVDDRTLRDLLARAYSRGAPFLPNDDQPPKGFAWPYVEIQGLGRLLLSDDRFKPGFEPIGFAELPTPTLLVERLVLRPDTRAVVAAFLERLEPERKSEALEDKPLAAALLAALTSGALTFLRPHRSSSAAETSTAGSPGDASSPDGDTSSRRTSSAVHWIEIKLVDEDGDPVAGEDYRITLPSGDVRTGKLDKDGKAKLDGLTESGSAKVAFPGIDAREWRVA